MATQTLTLIMLLLLTTTTFHLSTAQTKVKGAYWFPESEFPATSINATLFTHLFCAFATLSPTNFQISISSSCSSFTSTVRKSNPSIITLLSIGGGSANPSTFSSMASQSSSRASFINSTISTARNNGYSGVDMDWEYPATTTDMKNFCTLISELRAAITKEAQSSGKSALLITAAVSATPNLNSPSYPVSCINTNIDFLNIMAYDFYAPTYTPKVTSAHAALNDPSGGISGSSGITAWITAGMPANKMVLGLPFYGYAWQLNDPANHGLGAPANGVATATGVGIDADDGSISFNYIKSFIGSSGATTVYNSTYVVNYCYSGKTWIGYDDVDAVSAKVSYVKNKGLKGYFAWSVGGDYNWSLSQKASTTLG
ncbi:class V chitinase-like [Dioscorea cayenensis subsp. rotundata]|uniref:Class V chitinase-like n=1 Tax=Dioscorea cayennensis subsp. rotundata TaxID=55577 RepID=A0AB40BYG7_DIOCR|nr:class V chitinase-like [Dioscorea cayenensis subsp. rotundata]